MRGALPPARIQKHVLTRGAWSRETLLAEAQRAAAHNASAPITAGPLLAKPVQNEDGSFLFMCGVSRCGGGDVCGP